MLINKYKFCCCNSANNFLPKMVSMVCESLENFVGKGDQEVFFVMVVEFRSPFQQGFQCACMSGH